MILKLQSLLREEFEAGNMTADPDDLPPGDLGCDGRAKGKRKAAAKGPAAKRPRRVSKAKGQQPEPEWEDEEEFEVDELVARRVATRADRWETGTVLYRVVRHNLRTPMLTRAPYLRMFVRDLSSDPQPPPSAFAGMGRMGHRVQQLGA